MSHSTWRTIAPRGAAAPVLGPRIVPERQAADFSPNRLPGSAELFFRARSTIHIQGDVGPRVATISAGWAARTRTLADGRRQIVKILLPGDIIALDALYTGVADCGVEALTEVTARLFALQTPRALLEADRELLREVSELMHYEVVLANDHLTNMGTRSALARVGWFLLDVFDRLRQRGMVQGHDCDMPLTQAVIGETLGLASANVSRLLRVLREHRLLAVKHGRMTILDRAGLQRLSEDIPLLPDGDMRQHMAGSATAAA